MIRDFYHLVVKIFDRQEIRYLVAGGWNTVFGYGIYVALYYLFHAWIHYMIIAVVSNILAITMAYLTYKLLVFRTKGNILREYIKFYGVYGLTTILGLLALPFCIEVLKINAYIAPLLILVVTIVVSFFGHKHFSFRRS